MGMREGAKVTGRERKRKCVCVVSHLAALSVVSFADVQNGPEVS
jgi:hypothetical protein